MSSKEAEGQGRGEEGSHEKPACVQPVWGHPLLGGGCPDPCLVPLPMSRRVRESG